MGRKVITPEQEDFIRKNYLKFTDKELAEKLKMNYHNVLSFRQRESLKIPEHIIRERGIKASTGKTPHNKGKKMTDYTPPEVMERIKKNYFTKGLKPHNIKPIGFITGHKTGKGLRIKVREHDRNTNYEALTHYIWKQHHTTIPKGYVITFKNPNSDINCVKSYTIDNLELVTRRQLMDRVTINKAPKEIQEITRLRGLLTYNINKIERTRNKAKTK